MTREHAGAALATEMQPMHLLRGLGSAFQDGIILILVVYLFPLGILLIGTPIAFCARVVIVIVSRLWALL